jgi:hypothetical protein
MNDELDMRCNEAIVASFQVLTWNLPGEIEENHANLSQDSLLSGRYLNPGLSNVKHSITTFDTSV